MRSSFAAFALLGLSLAAGIAAYDFAPSARPPAPLSLAQRRMAALDIDGPAPLDVVFIGNSFTSYGPVPLVFDELLQAGDPARGRKVRMVEFPNSTLGAHVARREAKLVIETRGPWTYVVLQDHSTIVWTDPQGMHDAIKTLDGQIRAVGARTVLYMTWADAAASARDQEEIATAYERVGAEIGALVAPVGRAFFATGDLRPRLYVGDGHHPSPLGVYLVSCVFYALLTGKSPVGLLAEDVDAAASDLLKVQQVAEAAVRPH